VFGRDDNEAVILGSDGSELAVDRASKSVLADRIWQRVTEIWDAHEA
jgi:phosphopantothenoylcysteine decarboxylase/phosphopantothenate--cysteine ligase